jgi:hypothetical protein
MLRFKPVSYFVGQYHGFVVCALNIEDPISNKFLNSTSNTEFLRHFIVHFTKQLTDFWVTLYY